MTWWQVYAAAFVVALFFAVALGKASHRGDVQLGIRAPTLPRGSENLDPSVPGRPAPSPEGECDAEN